MQPSRLGPYSKRYKVRVACELCRQRKVKCDGARPTCGNCQKKDSLRQNCIYREAGPRGSVAEQYHANPASSSSKPQQTESFLQQESEPLQRSPERLPSELTPAQVQLSYCSSGSSSRCQRGTSEAFGKVSNFAFTGELKAAVEARLGLDVGDGPGLISVTNAPFFSSSPRDSRTTGGSSDLDFVLPPRRHADDLLGFFWRHIHPLEPLLEEPLLKSCYDALFAGTLVAVDERLFISLLNVIFALSTQLRESIDLEERNNTSGTYFQRAWNLLHYPNSVIWDHASVEVVQCLLLMTSYLKCTNNPHQTWMVAGSAVLIAQSLGLHRMEQRSDPHNSERRRRRQVWLGCLYMDRMLHVTYGRPTMVHTSQALAAIDVCQKEKDKGLFAPSSAYLVHSVELFEIIHHAVLLLYDHSAVSETFAQKVALPHSQEKKNALDVALQFDHCLSKWEQDLPLPLQHGAHLSVGDEMQQKQAIALRLRTAHIRIILFRPLLLQFCLSQSPDPTNFHNDKSLASRLVRDCAHLCVSNAQAIISLIDDHYKPDGSIGLISVWWYRVYYVHLAATVLIAAKLHPELSTQLEILESWEQALSILQVHSHFSPFIAQSVSNLQQVSTKVWESQTLHMQDGSTPAGGTPSAVMEDLFRDIGYDPLNPTFGIEDMQWLDISMLHQ